MRAREPDELPPSPPRVRRCLTAPSHAGTPQQFRRTPISIPPYDVREVFRSVAGWLRPNDQNSLLVHEAWFLFLVNPQVNSILGLLLHHQRRAVGQTELSSQ